jgi:hypothetical protein
MNPSRSGKHFLEKRNVKGILLLNLWHWLNGGFGRLWKSSVGQHLIDKRRNGLKKLCVLRRSLRSLFRRYATAREEHRSA